MVTTQIWVHASITAHDGVLNKTEASRMGCHWAQQDIIDNEQSLRNNKTLDIELVGRGLFCPKTRASWTASKEVCYFLLLRAFHKILHYKEVFQSHQIASFWLFFSKDSYRHCASQSTKLGLCFREEKKEADIGLSIEMWSRKNALKKLPLLTHSHKH